jgi:hypothetical protein
LSGAAPFTLRPRQSSLKVLGLRPSRRLRLFRNEMLAGERYRPASFWCLWRLGHSKPSQRMNAHFSAIEPWPFNENFTGVWGPAQTKQPVNSCEFDAQWRELKVPSGIYQPALTSTHGPSRGGRWTPKDGAPESHLGLPWPVASDQQHQNQAEVQPESSEHVRLSEGLAERLGSLEKPAPSHVREAGNPVRYPRELTSRPRRKARSPADTSNLPITASGQNDRDLAGGQMGRRAVVQRRCRSLRADQY